MNFLYSYLERDAEWVAGLFANSWQRCPGSGTAWVAWRWRFIFPHPSTTPRPPLQAGFPHLDPSAVGFDAGFPRSQDLVYAEAEAKVAATMTQHNDSQNGRREVLAQTEAESSPSPKGAHISQQTGSSARKPTHSRHPLPSHWNGRATAPFGTGGWVGSAPVMVK